MLNLNVLIINGIEFHKNKIRNQFYFYCNHRFPFLFAKTSSLDDLKQYNSTFKIKKYNSQMLILMIDILGDCSFSFIEPGIFKIDPVNLLTLFFPTT